MDQSSRTRVVIDTSVLLNFLAIDRADLLHRHPQYRFVITDHVRGEVTERRPDRLARFERAIADGYFELASVSTVEELEVFAKLLGEGRLDIGESAAAAMAIVQKLGIATDDRRAKKILARSHSELAVIDTAAIVRDLISASVLTVAEANRIKKDWATNHRFSLPFEKFE